MISVLYFEEELLRNEYMSFIMNIEYSINYELQVKSDIEKWFELNLQETIEKMSDEALLICQPRLEELENGKLQEQN